MRIPQYQVDAFAERLFAGNPAAVCVLERWLPEAVMQSIAAENALSETAFLVREGDPFRIRWFTPVREVELCGHATLASAAVVHWFVEPGVRRVAFESASGPLAVEVDGDTFRLDLPADPSREVAPPVALIEGLGGVDVVACRAGRYYAAILEHEDAVRAVEPDHARLASLDRYGIAVTAPGRELDFVSRFFAPAAGVPEDPVTGSAHCLLVPFWAGRLGRHRLAAAQLSARGGRLDCELDGDRVRLGGRAALYSAGELRLDSLRL
jgi:PhzF family phenazine biosynthesis protein